MTILTNAQVALVVALENEDGALRRKTTQPLLRTCAALAKMGLVSYEADEGSLNITLIKQPAPGETPAEEKQEDEKPTRGSKTWDTSLAENLAGEICQRTESGKLLHVPHNFPKGHAPLKKGDFANAALYFDWRATEEEKRAKHHESKGIEFRKKAHALRESDSPHALLAKIEERRQKMLAKLAAEEDAALALLAEQTGINPEDCEPEE